MVQPLRLSIVAAPPCSRSYRSRATRSGSQATASSSSRLRSRSFFTEPNSLSRRDRRVGPNPGTSSSADFVILDRKSHTSELQSPDHLVCRLLLEKKKKTNKHQ